MCICEICKKEFKNNLGGNLTVHLLNEHEISYENYIILTQYKNIPPKCKCGYCNERPVFYRGKFLQYALNHNTFEWKKEKYIEKWGVPKCKKCNTSVEFYRGNPRIYCSIRCFSLDNNGFCNPSIQEKIKSVVKEKYKVENVSQIPNVREKISKSKIGKTFKLTTEWKKHIGDGSRRKWLDQIYKKRVSKSIKKSLNTPEIKYYRSEILKKRWNCKEGRDDFLKKILNSLKNRLSKLHQKTKNELQLDRIGFVSEQRVGRYLVDELNEQKKIVIEINGDYVHANPKIYKSTDVIYLPGNYYTAQEKWDSDKLKRENLEKLGYKVVIIWESDDLYEHKTKISGCME